jgi:gamma-glutamyl:cysteine ligase YbdK (ATP-grasp superfamily)
MSGAPLGLFAGVGLELEYMIVDRSTLDALPLCDRVLTARAGKLTDEVEVGPLRWSNELALHLIELKTNGPAASTAGLTEQFQAGVAAVNDLLAGLGGQLLPGAMHPWFDPATETRLWPHDNGPIYAAYHRIFGCRGHGWSNLQSAHINLPFCGDREFGRLHAAIRLVLPLLPALAASSPVFGGKIGPALDNRLQLYRSNQQKIPQITGRVIPEAVFTAADYQRRILTPIYRAIAPFDPQALLQEEWLNSRGAIARFERSTLEIRVLDVQECPAADVAIAQLSIELLRALVEERWSDCAEQQGWSETPLANLFNKVVLKGERTLIEDADYLALFGYPGRSARVEELWRYLVESLFGSSPPEPLALILDQGPLARRLLRALGATPDRRQLLEVYRRLADCLATGRMFDA